MGAFQTKKDFTHWGSGLFAGLWILILGGFMQIFVGGEFTDTLMAVFGALLFSGFILFDTQMIMKRVSPEEYIVATIELYLDIINLFIEILKIMEKVIPPSQAFIWERLQCDNIENCVAHYLYLSKT